VRCRGEIAKPCLRTAQPLDKPTLRKNFGAANAIDPGKVVT
jgi:hypothetical protein